ncbi:MAG: virulence protein RhuM/Fic/DOC family protein [Chthonomonadales bacterium]|nr:virulence protein RhuM/Fic/DOC family protein [Chthonomonadales bacterium]
MGAMTEPPHGQIVVYEAPGGEVRVDVRLARETVWLSQRQMAEIFDTSTDNVGLHLKNVFGEGELDESATTEDYSVVQTEGRRRVRRSVRHYDLDAVISVGYRVNSRRGTQFRIWATRTLRDHLLRGYTLHERRLAERGLGEIEQAVGLLARTLTTHALVTDEGRAVLDVVQRYSRSWRLLLEYDEERLAERPTRPVAPAGSLTLAGARTVAARLREDLSARGEAGTLFGQERGEALAAILGAIEQTFGGEPLYPSAQARAAHLLYFAIKDHPFSDGNKRIGSLLFLDYLRRNGLLLRPNGEPRLADNAMVALALLIAESEPAQKELMVRLVLNLLEDGG